MFKTNNSLSFAVLNLSFSTSRGRDTYGYNIVKLSDTATGEQFKCMGGGYDMIGTVLAKWLEANFQDELLAIKERAHSVYDGKLLNYPHNPISLYGMTYDIPNNNISLDGGCGEDSIIKIAKALGLDVERKKDKKRNGYVHTGYYVSLKKAV